MPIPLGNTDSRPNVKLPQQGAGVEVAIVGTRTIPKMKFGNPHEQDTTRDGKPQNQLKVTGVVLSQSAASTAAEGQPVVAPQPGEIVDIYLYGHLWASWIDGENTFKQTGGAMNVGTIMLWHFTHTEPSQQAGANDRKVRTCTFRVAQPHEQWAVQQAEAAWHALGFGQPDTAPAPQPAQAPQSAGYGADPFPGAPQQPQAAPAAPQPAYGGAPAQQPPPYGGGQAPQMPPQPAPAGPPPAYQQSAPPAYQQPAPQTDPGPGF